MTESGLLRATWDGEEVGAIPARLLTDECPRYAVEREPRVPPPERPTPVPSTSEALLDLLASPALRSRMQLLRPRFFEVFGRRVVNTHSAPLPAFPGAHPIEDVLAAGVDSTAATVHWVDEGIDTGPVIRAERVPVEPDDTPDTLRARVQRVEHRILPEVVKELIAA